VIDNPHVSRCPANLTWDGRYWILQDPGSANGTLVDQAIRNYGISPAPPAAEALQAAAPTEPPPPTPEAQAVAAAPPLYLRPIQAPVEVPTIAAEVPASGVRPLFPAETAEVEETSRRDVSSAAAMLPLGVAAAMSVRRRRN
jgi:hypothetical protein